jgi:hypothetical protein
MHLIYCARLEICSEGTTGLSSARVHPIHSLRVRSPACHSAAETVTKIPGAAPPKAARVGDDIDRLAGRRTWSASRHNQRDEGAAVTFPLSLILTELHPTKELEYYSPFSCRRCHKPCNSRSPLVSETFFFGAELRVSQGRVWAGVQRGHH